MRIVWIVNFSMPAVQRKRELPVSSSGWWLDSISRKLIALPETELFVVSLVQGKDNLFRGVIDGVSYWVIPISYRNRQLKATETFCNQMQEVLKEIQPDIIHLQGSEFPIGIPFLKQTKIPVVLSIQGLISEIAKKDYSCPSIGICDSFSTYLIEKIKHWKNKKRAQSELYQLRNVKYVIGRTLWDRAHSFTENPNAKYFYLQECIRESFLHENWEITQAEPQTIFCAGGLASPLKGFHQILKAVAFLKPEFPNLSIKVCGAFHQNARYGYHFYLKKLIRKLGLEDNVEFLGQLDEQAMCGTFLQSRLYVMGSSIENSSNTLAEAMCLGVPAVVPFVGGVPSLATDEEEALYYRFEDTALLAYQIRRILSDDSLAEQLSENAKKRAKTQYATEHLAESLMGIYKEIINEK